MRQIYGYPIALLLVTACMLMPTGACGQNKKQNKKQIESSDPETFGADFHVVYKKNEKRDLRLYFFDPDGESQSNRPAVVFFFGGGWVGGTPRQFVPHAEYLKSRGVVAVLADYRTKRSHGTSPKECVYDAKSAVRFLRTNAKKFRIDASRIAAAGGSAGGHVAAATATLKELNQPNEDTSVSCVPNAMVLFNPVYNNGPGQWGHKTVKNYWKTISPHHNIRQGIPPGIVFLGDQDKLISVETAKAFQAKMKEAGSDSQLHVYDNMGHGFFNFGRNKNEPFADTVKKMDAFLVQHGFMEGKDQVDTFLKHYQPATKKNSGKKNSGKKKKRDKTRESTRPANERV